MVRRKSLFEFAVVCIALGILAVSIRVVGNGADYLWANETGIFYETASLISGPLSLSLDVPVAFATGILLGLYCLFFADGKKRVQAVLVFVFVGLFSFLPFIESTGRILDTVGRTQIPFVLGCAIGFAGGIGVSYSGIFDIEYPSNQDILTQLRWVQFPAATKGFFWGVSVFAMLTSVDYALTIANPVEQTLTLVAGGVMFLSLAVFTQYEYPRRIVVLSPPDNTRYKYHPYVLGGLYELARQEHDGFAADGDSDIQLSEAHGIGIEEQDDLPNRFGTDIRFGYESPVLGGSSTRKMTIESENWTTDQLQSVGEERDRDGIGAGLVFRGLRWIRRYLNLAIPQTVLNIFSTRNSNILSKLDHADTAILISPAPASEGDFPEGVEKYKKLCKRYDDTLATDVVIATIEAGPVAEAENLKINSRAFRNHCAHRLCVNDTDCRVVPVDRFAENRDYRGGFDELLEEVSK